MILPCTLTEMNWDYKVSGVRNRLVYCSVEILLLFMQKIRFVFKVDKGNPYSLLGKFDVYRRQDQLQRLNTSGMRPYCAAFAITTGKPLLLLFSCFLILLWWPHNLYDSLFEVDLGRLAQLGDQKHTFELSNNLAPKLMKAVLDEMVQCELITRRLCFPYHANPHNFYQCSFA